RTPRGLPSRSGGKSSTALAAASCDDRAAGARSHAQPETMLTRPAAVVGLESPLHGACSESTGAVSLEPTTDRHVRTLEHGESALRRTDLRYVVTTRRVKLTRSHGRGRRRTDHRFSGDGPKQERHADQHRKPAQIG